MFVLCGQNHTLQILTVFHRNNLSELVNRSSRWLPAAAAIEDLARISVAGKIHSLRTATGSNLDCDKRRAGNGVAISCSFSLRRSGDIESQTLSAA
jgi:hypothetical protein